ncbi:MAG: outer rane efflux protein [Acidobacteriaceae bacterium]|nr:outer rane efflux protein [Acidobacteriaceae bacterium]
MSFSKPEPEIHSTLMTLPHATAPSRNLRSIPTALRLLAVAAALLGTAHAQLSLTSVVDLALRSNPKVLIAQADVNKARAQLSESRDVYIPAVAGGSGLGYSYGFPLGQPTVFSLGTQSLLFNYSQKDYIRAARAGLQAANFALKDARQQVEEDVAITYLALDRAQQRKAALDAEYGFATRLVSIVQDRIDAGQENNLELLRSRRTTAQIRLLQIQLADEIATDADHLARLAGLPSAQLTTVSDSIPALSTPTPTTSGVADSPAISAAVANAAAKRQVAFGDSRYILRPQIAFVTQYSRFSNFNNYKEFYPTFNNYNAAAIGIQMTLPIFDRVHQDKAHSSMADAVHAEQEVRSARTQFLEGRLKLQHAASELSARAELASIDRELAQNQLDVLLAQLQSGLSNGGALMTPKDEQNARIQERQRYLDLLDADFQLRQTQINLLRQNGQLEDWLKSASQSQPGASAVSVQSPTQ